jgi:hypothetical protein
LPKPEITIVDVTAIAAYSHFAHTTWVGAETRDSFQVDNISGIKVFIAEGAENIRGVRREPLVAL